MKTLLKTGRIILLVLTLLTGLFLCTNIYVLGNAQAAIEMHDDLPRGASPILANAKVIKCFLVGSLFLIAAFGMIRKNYKLALAGVIGFVLFDVFYIYQIIRWSNIHPRMWNDFAIFGSLCTLIGIFSWYQWKRASVKKPASNSL